MPRKPMGGPEGWDPLRMPRQGSYSNQSASDKPWGAFPASTSTEVTVYEGNGFHYKGGYDEHGGWEPLDDAGTSAVEDMAARVLRGVQTHFVQPALDGAGRAVGVAMERSQMKKQLRPVIDNLKKGAPVDLTQVAPATTFKLGYRDEVGQVNQLDMRVLGQITVPEQTPYGSQDTVKTVVELPGVDSGNGTPVRAIVSSLDIVEHKPPRRGFVESIADRALGNKPMRKGEKRPQLTSNQLAPGKQLALRMLQETPQGLALGMQYVLPNVSVQSVGGMSSIREGDQVFIDCPQPQPFGRGTMPLSHGPIPQSPWLGLQR